MINEEEEEEGVVALVSMIVRLVEREIREEGIITVVTVDLVAAVWLVEGGENMTTCWPRDLVE